MTPARRAELLEQAHKNDDPVVQLLAVLIEDLAEWREDLRRREAEAKEEAARFRRELAREEAGARSSPAGQSYSGGDAMRGSQEVKFGRDKGKPLRLVDDLAWIRAATIRSIEDPSKGQWRGRNLDDLAAIDAEIARRGGSGSGRGAPGDDPTEHWGNPPPVDEFGPPPSDDIGF